jgi:predicted regulator of Ras-like GTPase activity (Roadblock/LC7/MglB family)
LSTTFSGDEYVVIHNPVIDALASGHPPWDEKVLTDLTDLAYTRAVVFTDGIGRVLYRVTRSDPPKRIGEVVDIASGGLSQMGSQLGLGTPGVCVCTFQSGVVILARSDSARVAVLADENANLGQLLNHVRQIFPRVGP